LATHRNNLATQKCVATPRLRNTEVENDREGEIETQINRKRAYAYKKRKREKLRGRETAGGRKLKQVEGLRHQGPERVRLHNHVCVCVCVCVRERERETIERWSD